MAVALMDAVRKRKNELEAEKTKTRAAIETKIRRLVNDPILGRSMSSDVEMKVEQVTTEIMDIIPANSNWLWDTLISNVNNASQALTVLTNIIIKYKSERYLEKLQAENSDSGNYKAVLISEATTIVNEKSEQGIDVLENIDDLRKL